MSTTPKNHALAARLARRLDVSMTEAVTVALKDKPAATEPGVALEQRLARFLTLRKRGACPPLF
jgi:hypothetical protein